MPCEPPKENVSPRQQGATAKKGRHLVELYRPELIQSFQTVSFSSDSFSLFEKHDPKQQEHQKDLADLYSHLIETVIPSFATDLDNLVEDVTNFGAFNEVDARLLTKKTSALRMPGSGRKRPPPTTSDDTLLLSPRSSAGISSLEALSPSCAAATSTYAEETEPRGGASGGAAARMVTGLDEEGEVVVAGEPPLPRLHIGASGAALMAMVGDEEEKGVVPQLPGLPRGSRRESSSSSAASTGSTGSTGSPSGAGLSPTTSPLSSLRAPTPVQRDSSLEYLIENRPLRKFSTTSLSLIAARHLRNDHRHKRNGVSGNAMQEVKHEHDLLRGAMLTQSLHERGICIRHLGLLRAKTTCERVKTSLLVEALARVVKSTMRRELRNTLASAKVASSHRFRQCLCDVMNQIFVAPGFNPAVDVFW